MDFKLVLTASRAVCALLCIIAMGLTASGTGLTCAGSTASATIKISDWGNMDSNGQYFVLICALVAAVFFGLMAAWVMLKKGAMKPVQMGATTAMVILLFILGALEAWYANGWNSVFNTANCKIAAWEAAAAFYFITMLIGIADVIITQVLL